MRLNHDAGAALLARAAVRDLLADHPTTDELRHDAALVVYELVSNAVTHGLPEADGRISLTCEVVGDALVVRRDRRRPQRRPGDQGPRPRGRRAVAGSRSSTR